jgi:Divergent InlB B-repeat domain/Putative Ig domain
MISSAIRKGGGQSYEAASTLNFAEGTCYNELSRTITARRRPAKQDSFALDDQNGNPIAHALRVSRTVERYWKVKVLFLFVVLVASGKPVFSQTGSASNILLVQSVECEQSGISGSYACTLTPTGTGHLLTAQEFDFANTPGTPATSAGWTQDCVKNNGSAGQITYYSYPNAPSGITSVTFTPSSGASSAVVSEWSGMATSSPFDGCDGYVDNGGRGAYWFSGAKLSSQTDLAIGAALNRANVANGFAPSDVWTELMDAPQTHNGVDEGWTAYIVNGLKSPFTALGTTASAVDVLSTVALYKSAVAGTAPTGALVSSYSDFESGTNGTTLTTAILNAGTHGMGINQWTLDNSTAFTVCTAGSLPSYSNTTTNGTTYAAGAGTRGICYNMKNGGQALESMSSKTVTLYVNVNLGANATAYSNPVIIGNFGVDDAAFTIKWTGELELECPFASPEDYPISGSNLAQANTTYGIWLQYDSAGGHHTIKIYSNPTTNPSLIGTATCPAQGSTAATTLGFGEFHGGAVGLTGIRAFDSFLWDVSGNGINVTAPGNTAQVTVGTNPAGLSYSVDGIPYSSAQILTWTIGTNHTLTTTSSQSPAVGTQDNFVNWSDGTTTVSDAVTATTGTTSFTASFNTSYQLTTSVSPAGSGTVSPTTGGYDAQGSAVPLVATPNANYSFAGWTGNVANANSASTTITMNAPQSVTAKFATTTQAPAITSASSTTFTVNVAGSFTVTATGIPTPTISEAGALPSGVSFNALTNVLSGTPAAGTAAKYHITFTASNGVGTNAVQSFALTVVNPAKRRP